MRTPVILPILLTVGLSQHHQGLLGDIPAKIHMEIFSSDLNAPYAFPKTLTASLLQGSVHYDYRNGLVQNYTNATSKVPLATDLFAPAIVKTPAATKGQVEAYMKALEEEAQQELKERLKQQRNLAQSQRYLVDLEPKAISYVNVKLGGTQNVKYHYQS